MEMINLLPSNNKKQIKAGRANVILVRYNLMLVLSIIFLVTAVGFAYYYLSTTKVAAEEAINDNTGKEGSYAAVKAEADNFRTQLENAKVVLNDQTSFAKAALNIAKLLPNGTSLNSLKLDKDSFSKPLVLPVNIANEQAAAELLNNFKGSPLFSNVTKGKISVGTGAYPYTMELSVTMTKAAAQ
jgi:hypothetical protein